jgi:hypothetical protein
VTNDSKRRFFANLAPATRTGTAETSKIARFFAGVPQQEGTRRIGEEEPEDESLPLLGQSGDQSRGASLVGEGLAEADEAGLQPRLPSKVRGTSNVRLVRPKYKDNWPYLRRYERQRLKRFWNRIDPL